MGVYAIDADQGKRLQGNVDDAHRLLGSRSHGIECFPTFLLMCLEKRVWEFPRVAPSGKSIAPLSFHDFVHTHYPAGLDSSYEALEAIVIAEPKLVGLWQEVSGRKLGAAPVVLPLARIRLDGGTQSRATISDETVSEYQDHLAELPPIVVFFDGTDHWLADGFHRLEAHRRAERDRITAHVRSGSLRDAILFSVGANTTHGLRRTNADKQRAVETLLKDAEWGKKSDRWIAHACAVSHTTVNKQRSQVANFATCPLMTSEPERLGQDGKVYRRPPSKKAPPTLPPEPADAPASAPEGPPVDEETALFDAPAVRPKELPEPAPEEPRVSRQMSIYDQIATAPKTDGARPEEPTDFDRAKAAVALLTDAEWLRLLATESARRSQA